MEIIKKQKNKENRKYNMSENKNIEKLKKLDLQCYINKIEK